MNHITKFFTVTAVVLLFAVPASAQSRIMDATIEWSGANATLKVFLTDTNGLTGLQCGLGNSADTMNVYNTTYSISGNSFNGGGGTVTDNILSVPLGSYPTGADYYSRIRVMLSNSFNEIEIHSHN